MSMLTDTKFKAEYQGLVEPGVRMFWLVEGKVSLVAPTTEDAKRVAACWNACIGLSTEDLEKNGFRQSVGKEITSRLEAQQQRDELLKALKELMRFNGSKHEYASIKELARDAIAKAEAAS
jgi:hypothetical protein